MQAKGIKRTIAFHLLWASSVADDIHKLDLLKYILSARLDRRSEAGSPGRIVRMQGRQ